MSFSCIIVDDDLHALDQLTEYIHRSAHLNLVKSFSNPVSAMEYIQQLFIPIDILFTDVEMPLLSGLELAKTTQQNIRLLVLVSSHLHYAIDGYNVNAQQFLSKPFDYRKFERVVENIIQKIKPVENFINLKLSGKNQSVKINLTEVIFIESASNYLKIHTKNKTYVPYGSLQSMQDNLSVYTSFLRINRSVIINVNFITSTTRYQITLVNDVIVKVGESYQKTYDLYFRERINRTGK